MNTPQQREEQITLYAVELLIERLNTTTHTYYLIQPDEKTHTFFFTLMRDDIAIFSETNISCVFAFLRGMIYILDK